MGPSNLLELVLQIRYHLILSILNLLNRLGYRPNRLTINMGRLQHFIQLQVLDLKLLTNGGYLFLQNQVVKPLALVD
jgi:hypothetical protein